MRKVTPSALLDLMLHVAPVRPVFVWGPPGIGKTAIVEEFGRQVGYRVVSLLGSQLAAEDLIGVPRIVDDFSVFAPPRLVAGHGDPIILFCDEFNASSSEVQKAFYSLITEQRIGEYRLPQGSVVMLASNRPQDNAITRTVSSALMNRVLHVELVPSPRDWLVWAHGAGIHELVTRYIETRPDHLFSAPPKTEEPFSTPRSWHILSDALARYPKLDPGTIALLAEGALSPSHAANFVGFCRGQLLELRIDDVIEGRRPLPTDPAERDLLTFVIQSLRTQLVKELPPAADGLTVDQKDRIAAVRRLVRDIARVDEELLLLLFAREEGEHARNYPAWFIAQMADTLGRLGRRITAA